MPNDQTIKIEVKGLDVILAKMDKFPRQIVGHLSQAGQEAADKVLLPTVGLKRYPPETEANRPPAPYYIRGRGMQYSNRNAMNSERLGTRWYVKSADLKTAIGNSASYAKWVHGDDTQARAMTEKGKQWKKLFETAKDKVTEITKVYQGWVNKLFKDLNL